MPPDSDKLLHAPAYAAGGSGVNVTATLLISR